MTLRFTEEQRKAIETADMVNFGSGPSAYAFEYDKSGVQGFNFGMTPSSFAMEQQLFEHVSPMLPQGCAVIFTVCPFSFGKNNSDSNIKKRYSRYFRIYESAEPSRDLWFPYGAVREENGCGEELLKKRTESMLKTWSQEFDLSLAENKPLDVSHVTERNADEFKANRFRLMQLLEAAEKRGLRPYVMLPPLAETLRKSLPDGLLNVFIYENLKKLPDIRLLDFTEKIPDTEFIGPVFLSLNGAVRFTQMIAGKYMKNKK